MTDAQMEKLVKKLVKIVEEDTWPRWLDTPAEQTVIKILKQVNKSLFPKKKK